MEKHLILTGRWYSLRSGAYVLVESQVLGDESSLRVYSLKTGLSFLASPDEFVKEESDPEEDEDDGDDSPNCRCGECPQHGPFSCVGCE